jgi:glycosyltransferase involved in cell wall biosynthesis
MKIAVYTITYNEEDILPFFIEYYSKFADVIIIYDNNSTDNTVQIAKQYSKVSKIISVDTNDRLDDNMYIEIRNSCWKDSDYDYVILVDADEFIYHDLDIRDYLNKTNFEVYQPKGYNMISLDFPKPGTLITEQIKTGIADRMYDKPVIFKPNSIKSVEYSLGTHSGVFHNGEQYILPHQSDLKLLHYKNLGFPFRIKKHKLFASRLSDSNIANGAGVHYTWSEQTQKEEFDMIFNNKSIII